MLLAIGHDDGRVTFVNPVCITSAAYEPADSYHAARLIVELDADDRAPLGSGSAQLVFNGREADAALCGLMSCCSTTVNMERVQVQKNGKPS